MMFSRSETMWMVPSSVTRPRPSMTMNGAVWKPFCFMVSLISFTSAPVSKLARSELKYSSIMRSHASSSAPWSMGPVGVAICSRPRFRPYASPFARAWMMCCMTSRSCVVSWPIIPKSIHSTVLSAVIRMFPA